MEALPTGTEDNLLALFDAVTDGVRWYAQPEGQPVDLKKLLEDLLAFVRMPKGGSA